MAKKPKQSSAPHACSGPDMRHMGQKQGGTGTPSSKAAKY